MPTIAAAEALDSAEPGKPLTGAAAVGIELDPDPAGVRPDRHRFQ